MEMFQIVRIVTSCCNAGTNELNILAKHFEKFKPCGSLYRAMVTHAPAHTILDHFLASMYWLNLRSIFHKYTTQLKLGIQPNFYTQMLVKTQVFCSKIFIVHLVMFISWSNLLKACDLGSFHTHAWLHSYYFNTSPSVI